MLKLESYKIVQNWTIKKGQPLRFDTSFSILQSKIKFLDSFDNEILQETLQGS